MANAAPWSVGPDAEGLAGFFSVWQDVGGTGAEIAGRIGEEDNAHLIAAARAMREALEAILFQINQGKVLERDACITQARAALVKAMGRRQDA